MAYSSHQVDHKQSWGPLLKEVIHYILHTTFEKGNALLYLITPWRQ